LGWKEKILLVSQASCFCLLLLLLLKALFRVEQERNEHYGEERERERRKGTRALALYSQHLNFQPIIRSARNLVRVLRVVDELLESSLQTLDDVNVLKIGRRRRRRRGV